MASSRRDGPKDVLVDAAVGLAIGVGVTVALATFGVPLLAAGVVAGGLAGLGTYLFSEHRSHRQPNVRGALLATGTGLVLGVAGGVATGALARVLVAAPALRAVSLAGQDAGFLATGALTGDIETGVLPGDIADERGIAASVPARDQLADVYRRLRRDRPSSFFSAREMLALPTGVAATGEPFRAPPGTVNAVIGVIAPLEEQEAEHGYDHNLVAAPAIADAYGAHLITGPTDRPDALTRRQVHDELASLTRDARLNALVVIGHSAVVPSDRDRLLCSAAEDARACLGALPTWSGIGVMIGDAAHPESLVPGLQTILGDIARQRGVAVRDLFGPEAKIELIDCNVGASHAWLQDLANLTGARVIAYEGEVDATAGDRGGHPVDVWRGVDDGAVSPRPSDGRVVFYPKPRSPGLLAALSEVVRR